MIRLCTLIVIVLALALALSGCPKPQAAPPPAPVATAPAVTGELVVFVPCGIAGPYGETKKLFEERYPGIKVTQDLANIDVHTKKIADGKAAPDIFLALGDREMQRVMKLDRVAGEPVTYAYNSIALMVAKNNPCEIDSLQDLTKPKVKTIALATPENSSGYYMTEALKKAGVYEQVKPKLWLTPEPAMVKTQLSSGKADVGVVYYPCTRETQIIGGQPKEVGGKLQLLGKIPTELSGQIPAQAAIIKGAKNPEAARLFLQMLLEPQAQDAWEKFAFDRAVTDPNRVTLYCYCGAGIRPMMDEAVAAYKQIKPNVRIDVGYAGSGCLLSQLTFSQRGDLYMPGEDYYINQAKDRGYITTTQPIGYFEPVILVQKGNPKAIKTLADLAKPGMAIGLGEPSVAAVGLAAKKLLEKANLLEPVKKNVKYWGGNVPELGNQVKLKTLDATIVWNVTAAQVVDACDTVQIDRALYEPSLVPLGLLKFSKHQAEAQGFVTFLSGPEGQKIVGDSGMTAAQ